MSGPEVANASTALSQRNEFVRAFVEHAAEKPASERMMVRWPTLITVSAVAAVAAVVVGVFWSLIKPLKPGEKLKGPDGSVMAKPLPKPKHWSGVAGWDCTAAADRGFEAQGRNGDWRRMNLGGWAQDGCRGTYTIAPVLTGDDAKRQAQTAVWWFGAAGMKTCRISVYVPPAGSVTPSADLATKASYSVMAGDGGTSYADFTVNQSTAGENGGWTPVGAFPVHDGRLSVRLNPTGNAKPGSWLAMAQMKVDCDG